MSDKELCSVAVTGPQGILLTYAPGAGRHAVDLIGYRVEVRIGSRKVVGVVVGTTGSPPEGVKLREIEDVLGEHPSVSPEILKLTRWIGDYYFCDWATALGAALPSGLMRAPSLQVKWIGPELEGQWPDEVQANRSLTRLARAAAGLGRTTFATLAKGCGSAASLTALRSLEKFGLVEVREKFVLDSRKSHTEEWVRLTDGAGPDGAPGRALAQRRALTALVEASGEMKWRDLRSAARVQRPILKALCDGGLATVERRPKQIISTGFDPRATSMIPELSPDQSRVVDRLVSSLDKPGFQPFLLNGAPGSGKTRVYVEALKRAVELGRGAILLVPEIALTPQVVARIRAAVEVPVVIQHSALNPAQRVAAWREVNEGRARIVVGPRSAVFAPVHDLGLLIVDEEHEESFKQQDPAPRYHGRDVALVRGRQAGATVVLVSATPSLESMRLVEEGKVERLDLAGRFGAGWPLVTVVDRRREGPDAPYIGPALAREIESRLRLGEGILLMITRRGYAPVLVCNDCGEREMCPNCAVSLTLHGVPNRPRLRCHICGYSKRVGDVCPSCGGIDLGALGAGTQRVEEEIVRRYPAMMPVRMDRDSARRRGAHERILRAFSSGEAQILLGTQMVAKGHDFSHVTLVGVVNADPSLFLPDFRAAERTFRLLVQAAGRAGRGEKPGEVVIQTLTPEHPVFLSLMEPDIDGFLRRESELRRSLDYPPYARMAMVTFSAARENEAANAAEKFTGKCLRIGAPLMPTGPAPAYLSRVKRRYRWRVLLRTRRADDPDGAMLRGSIRKVSAGMKLGSGVTMHVDVDPVEVI